MKLLTPDDILNRGFDLSYESLLDLVTRPDMSVCIRWIHGTHECLMTEKEDGDKEHRNEYDNTLYFGLRIGPVRRSDEISAVAVKWRGYTDILKKVTEELIWRDSL